MSISETLPELLHETAARRPEASLTFLQRDRIEGRLTYRELHSRALSGMEWLQQAGVEPGTPVIIQVQAERRQIELFWASIFCGAVPVLLPHVASWRRESEAGRRLIAVCRQMDGAALVVDAGVEESFAANVPAEARGRVRLMPDAPDHILAAAPRPHACKPDDLAFIQFSSGTIGQPKGVRLTHANLLCNIRDMIAAGGLTAADVYLSWMPYSHDMGLVGFHLTPVALGGEQIKLQVADFAADPRRWLNAVKNYRATTIGCPNFGLRLVLDKLGPDEAAACDLSSVVRLFNGAEPISAQTMRNFLERFAPAGLRPEAMQPVYGMAEACLGATFPPRGEAPLVHRLEREALHKLGQVKPAEGEDGVIEFVDVGYPLPSMDVRVIGGDGQPVAPGSIGDVEIRGPNVTRGFWGQPDFAGGAFSPGGWLNTGDVGAFIGDRLVIVGRRKDLIFINGRNVPAHDLEEAICAQAPVKPGQIAACGVSDPATGLETVVIFVAARAGKDEWLEQIRAAATEFLAYPVQWVVQVPRIPRTTSGKLQRYKLAQEFLGGAFDQTRRQAPEPRIRQNAESRASDGLRALVSQIWADVLGFPGAGLDHEASFAAFGGTSIKALEMLTRLEDALGRRFGYALLFACRSIGDIVDYIGAHDRDGNERNAEAKPIAASGQDGETEAVAVIGMAGQFPGASDLGQFWEDLAAGRCRVTPVPATRWRGEGPVEHMGCLDGVDLFAADFFGISPAEAVVMDPQQRLVLEVAYAALEDAGHAGTRMASDRKVGVYFGAGQSGYFEEALKRRGDAATAHPGLMSGNLQNIVAARIAHSFDFKGPALTIDTACSSSLVALKYACADLLSGECDLALVGGVNILATPTAHDLFRQAGALSETGQCRAFDSKADGMVPGEGLGVVVLKRLDKAIADGDRTDAVILAVAANNDGRSIGIMAPRPEGQDAVLAAAYAKAGISPATVSYVEAHGTGTPIGDPVEFRALARILAREAGSPPCGLGSVKTNIGHLLAAAGIAGLIKVILALRHQMLPPTLNLDDPHPHITFDETAFFPVTAPRPWPRGVLPRIAGVSSFGFGGTNAHAVVREAPPEAARPAISPPWPLCLSARNEEELRRLALDLARRLETEPETDIRDVSFTRALGRQNFELKTSLVVPDREKAAEALHRLADNIPARTPQIPEKLALHLSGGAAALLGETTGFAVFDAAIRDCRSLAPAREDGAADRDAFIADYAQGLTWLRCGLRPAAISGNGQGAVAAACLAGCLSLRDALGAALSMLRPERQDVPALSLSPPSIRLIIGGTVFEPHEPITLDALSLALRKAGGTVADEARLEAGLRPFLAGDGIAASFYPADGIEAASWRDSALRVLSALWAAGFPIDWTALFEGCGARIASLPAYPFARRSFWLDRAASAGLPAAIPDRIWTAEGRCLDDWFYATEWREIAARRPGAAASAIALIHDGGVLAALLAAALRARGCTVQIADAHSFAADDPRLYDVIAAQWAESGFDPDMVCDLRGSAPAADARAEMRAALASGEQAVAGLLLLAQMLARRSKAVSCVAVTAAVAPADAGNAVPSLIGAALTGFVRSAARDPDAIAMRAVDIDGARRAEPVTCADLAEEILSGDTEASVALRGGRRLRETIVPLATQAPGRASGGLVHAGCYVVIGGLGGIGAALSEWLSRHLLAHVVLVGRRAMDDGANEILRAVRAGGGEAQYIQADISDEADMARLAQRLRELGRRIDGVIHAGGVLADRRIAEMGLEDLSRVLRPKVSGSLRLLNHLAPLRPGAFVFFSSLAGLIGNAGQAGHSAANYFEDALAALGDRLGLPIRSIAWGLWGDHGVVASRDHVRNMRRLGVHPMDTASGIAAFVRAMAAEPGRLVIANLSVQARATCGIAPDLARLTTVCEAAASDAGLAANGLDDGIESLCGALLAARLDHILPPPGGTATEETIFDRAKLRPDRGGLMRRYLQILTEDGHLAVTGKGYERTAAPPPRDPEEVCARLLAEQPRAAAAVRLLRRCVDALPDILSGGQSAVDVLFAPAAAADLASMYRDYPPLARAHEMAAAAVTATIGDRPGERLSLLEIGAGTGALTETVLAHAADRLGAYVFTDISTAFTAAAGRKFAGVANFSTALFDLDKDPRAQGLGQAAFDIVIGVNVLHAVPDIRRALANLRRTMRPDSRLILVETVRPHRVADCTVGLLDGWWTFADAELRPDYPLLASRQWEAVLHDENFRATVIPIRDGGRDEASPIAVIVAVAEEGCGLAEENAAAPAEAAPRPAPAARMDGRDGTGLPDSAPAFERIAEFLEKQLAALDAVPADRDQSFAMTGLDSLSALELCNAVQARLDIALRPAALFEHDSVTKLAQHILAGHPHLFAAAETVPAARSPQAPPQRIPRVEAAFSYDLSPAQKRLWFLAQMEPGNPFYNIEAAFELRGPLSAPLLGQALRLTVEEQEALRTRFGEIDGRPCQIVENLCEAPLPVHDLAQHPEPARQAALRELRLAAARQPFDLRMLPLFRMSLVRLEPEHHVLVLVMHHIIGDGWSLNVLARRLAFYYNQLTAGGDPAAVALEIHYKDYAVRQNRLLDGGALAPSQDHWLKILDGEPPALDMPTDCKRPPTQSYRGAIAAISCDENLTAALEELSRRHGLTMFMTLLSALYMMLSRLTGQNDIVVATPVAGRNHPQVEGLIGFFVNMLPLRIDLADDPFIEDLMGRVRETATQAYAHQDFPYERIVELINPTRDLSRASFFDLCLVYQNRNWEEEAAAAFDGISGGSLPDLGISAKMDLVFLAKRTASGLDIRLEYATDLYGEETPRQFLRYLRNILETMTRMPRRRVSDFPLLSADEAEALSKAAAPRLAVESQDCLHGLFERQARSNPDRIAVTAAGQSLTYGELEKRSNKLAHRLRRLGVGPETLVGLCLDRSVELIVGILGIMKAGAAYVPLDPEYPSDRLAFMLETAKAPVVVAKTFLRGCLGGYGGPILDLDAESAAIAALPDTPPDGQADAGQLAYVIFTSGSTGRPKGVMVTHRNVVGLFESTRERFHFGAEDIWTLFHSQGFDFSVWEIWGALLHGGRLVVVDADTRRSPPDFLDLLVESGATILNQTPSAFYQLADALAARPDLTGRLALRTVIFGGEKLDFFRLRPWLALAPATSAKLINMYGITETTVHVTYHELRSEDVESPASFIGAAIPDLGLHLLDSRLTPTPAGVIGEIHVAGDGLARGYLACPGLTAERFVPNPFGPPGSRLYRSGDIARHRADGQLDYIGRSDHQVKLRGFRIELGEIEAALLAQPGIAQAVVVPHDDGGGDKTLLAYIVADRQTGELDIAALRGGLKSCLPDYMVPAAFIAIDAIPLTENGKLARKALPPPHGAILAATAPFVPPRNEIEARLCTIIGEILHRDRVGVEDDFFELGGHSLLATQVVSHIRTAFAIELPLKMLFQEPTVAGLAQHVQTFRLAAQLHGATQSADAEDAVAYEMGIL